MAKGGKEYRRLVAAFERIFGATIFFGTDSTTTTTRVVHRARFNFLREATIDQLEKRELIQKRFVSWRELFPWFAGAGFGLWLLGLVAGDLFKRRVP